MPDLIKDECRPPIFAEPNEIALGELLRFVGAYSDRPLVFVYDGRAVKSGYHVTEVKAGQFAALDCGANPESWAEIFIQLWDVAEEERQHMTAGKFSAIIRKVSEHVGLEPPAKLTFEVSDGVAPMQLYRAREPEIVNGDIHIALTARPASCKPRDRWLAEQNTACCAGDALSNTGNFTR